MSTILKITNPANELVISSDGQGLHCIGRAGLVELVQASGSATARSPGRRAGYSRYRINWPGPVLFAVDLPLGKRVGILGAFQVSPGVWEVRCHCGTDADANQFDITQYALDVWAYGVPQTPQTGMVFQIFKPDGTLAYDLTRPNILFPRAFALARARSSGITIPALTRPVIIGTPASTFSAEGAVGVHTYDYVSQRSMWRRESATVVKEDVVTLQRYQYFSEEPLGLGEGLELFNTPCFLIEGATLP
ncbi:hypothetical protein [Massilia sp. METH4]|uniref:hypothetical protein n=1 Tax=Massilia sp. METH4 TaxID=3123041 RepID=UPI0030CD3036